MAKPRCISDLEFLMATATARAERFAARANDPTERWPQQCAYNAARARNRAEQLREEIEAMRIASADTSGTSMISPGPDWCLVVSKAGGLKFGDKQYRHGEEVDPSELAKALHGDHLLQHGHVKWRPRAALNPPPPKPAFQPPPAAQVSLNLIEPLLAEIERVAAERQCNPLDVPLDCVNNSVLMRAYKYDVDQPKWVQDGGWGSGGGGQVRSGEGTARRIADWDGFVRRVRERLEARGKAA
jgi:hypothetical protein